MAYREDVSTLKLNDTKNTFIFPMTDIHWKVKWSRIEKYEKKSMESFIVGLGTVQTLKTK
jgi:hypothetical protein